MTLNWLVVCGKEMSCITWNSVAANANQAHVERIVQTNPILEEAAKVASATRLFQDSEAQLRRSTIGKRKIAETQSPIKADQPNPTTVRTLRVLGLSTIHRFSRLESIHSSFRKKS